MSLINLDSALSLYSIPAIWLTAFYPAAMKTGILRDTPVGYNNLHPRGNVERAKTAANVDKAAFQRAARCEGAHLNGMENLPIWFAAILAAHLAGLPNRTLNLVSAAYVVTRVVYNYVYINQSTPAQGWLRSAAYFTGLAMPLGLLIQSANKIHTVSLLL
ncbi:hypothetical protein BDW22DRAFT_1363408 [Trametopsis cervina]|nr:hypothetical protein BDW22DRAFT_1363408 [Trametopsis cervina]